MADHCRGDSIETPLTCPVFVVLLHFNQKPFFPLQCFLGMNETFLRRLFGCWAAIAMQHGSTP